MQINEKAKPFIKWAGGKGQLLSQLDKYLPRRLYNEDFTYVEPFTGGGICNADTILADSALLNKVDIEITNRSFEETADFIKSDRLTFFYFDPPYRPLDATSSFTSYAKGDFNDDDQRKLAAFCRQIDSPNCLWMLSNSDCSAKNPDDLFFEDLYNDFNIERVWASRSINANPSKRGKLTELLIRNDYEIDNRLLSKAV